MLSWLHYTLIRVYKTKSQWNKKRRNKMTFMWNEMKQQKTQNENSQYKTKRYQLQLKWNETKRNETKRIQTELTSRCYLDCLKDRGHLGFYDLLVSLSCLCRTSKHRMPRLCAVASLAAAKRNETKGNEMKQYWKSTSRNETQQSKNKVDVAKTKYK